MSRVQELLAFLDSFEPESARDRSARETAKAFVRTNVNVLHRSNLQGHFTASAFVMDPERTRFLLVRHRKLGKWIQPGGHADGDADLLAVASREVREETGLEPEPANGRIFDIDIHRIPAAPGVPAHLHYDVRFLFVADPGAPLSLKRDECHEAAWMSRAEARRRGIVLEPSVERMVTRALGC